jgi:hypothetical protein
LILEGTYNMPWSLLSKKENDPDLPSYAEAMGGQYSEEFKAGQRKELAQLEKLNCWTEVPRSSVPCGHNIINSRLLGSQMA